MVRLPREYSSDHYHHVTSRGNWRMDLFRNKGDYRYFLNLIGFLHKKYGIELASYCLMTNHYHILILSKHMHISSTMARINKAYADYYNKRYKVSGHLFEKRFYSKPIYDNLGVAEVSRYIHLNPIEAQITHTPQRYEWSSYRFLQKHKSTVPPYLNLEPILTIFPGNNYRQRVQNYCLWTQQKINIVK